MPKVTAIRPQKHRPDRFSVFLDGAFGLALSADNLVSSGLHVGQELTTDQLDTLRVTLTESKAYQVALNLLSYRKHTQLETRRHLERKGYEPESISVVLVRLEAEGWLDDAEFAGAWTRNRQTLKPTSRRKLAAELASKGVSKEAIDAQLGEIGHDEELAAIKKIIKQKLTQSRYQDQLKLTRYLTGQGFDYTSVKEALKGADED